MEHELLVKLVHGGQFVHKVENGHDPDAQVRQILEEGLKQRHNEGYTLHPPHQIRSVRVQKKGTAGPSVSSFDFEVF